VADNLIRNALAKRVVEPGVRVRVALRADGLSVCDTGKAIPEHVARALMRAPIASAAGLGIGLYQAARQAEAIGYRLALEKNSDGEVCLGLRLPPPSQGSTPAAASRP
jgi:signal transduction histidine kinase